jgi:gamma-glutamylcyclotransferase
MKVNNTEWCFAYGSNLCLEQMHSRIDFQGKYFTCRLPDYKMVFNKRSSRTPGKSFANIVPDISSEVWGVAYACSESQSKILDVHEGILQKHYVHHIVEVLSKSGKAFRALTYIAGSDFICDDCKPAADYVRLIVNGAHFHNLPESYINWLEDKLFELECHRD